MKSYKGYSSYNIYESKDESNQGMEEEFNEILGESLLMMLDEDQDLDEGAVERLKDLQSRASELRKKYGPKANEMIAKAKEKAKAAASGAKEASRDAKKFGSDIKQGASNLKKMAQGKSSEAARDAIRRSN